MGGLFLQQTICKVSSFSLRIKMLEKRNLLDGASVEIRKKDAYENGYFLFCSSSLHTYL